MQKDILYCRVEFRGIYCTLLVFTNLRKWIANKEKKLYNVCCNCMCTQGIHYGKGCIFRKQKGISHQELEIPQFPVPDC